LQGIVVEVYSPSGNNVYGHPRAVDDPVVAEIAQQLNVQPAQVLIQWAVQRGTVALPKSVTPSRIAANFQDFDLPREAVDKINALDKNHRNNFPSRYGVDIFGDRDAETLKKGVQEWVAKQRELKGKS
jgi:L-glyceraldehyde reductase